MRALAAGFEGGRGREGHFPSDMAALLIPALAAGIGFKSMKFAWDTAKHSHLFARKHHHHHSAAAVLPTTPAAMPVETGQGLRRRKRHPRKPKRKLPRRNTASAARLSGGVEHFTYACVPARCRFYRMTSLCPGCLSMGPGPLEKRASSLGCFPCTREIAAT